MRNEVDYRCLVELLSLIGSDGERKSTRVSFLYVFSSPQLEKRKLVLNDIIEHPGDPQNGCIASDETCIFTSHDAL